MISYRNWLLCHTRLSIVPFPFLPKISFEVMVARHHWRLENV